MKSLKYLFAASLIAAPALFASGDWQRKNSLNPKNLPEEPYQGSLFSEVWEQVSSDPYGGLPIHGVTIKKFFVGLKNYILSSSERTLNVGYDILPYFDKLVHPNGICFSGTWNITKDNPYTGYFRPGTRGLIIVRASTALTNTLNSAPRVFGFSGKIYPTGDPNHEEPLKTANFFAINDLGGQKLDYYLNAEMTNDLIKVSPTITAIFNTFVGLAAAVNFSLADESNLQTALIRELYPISQLGEPASADIHTPVWIKVEGAPGVPRVYAEDFRTELDMENYPEGLKFDISVASEGSRVGWKDWHKIGYIHLKESVVSDSCDHRLHFAHPKNTRIYVNPLGAAEPDVSGREQPSYPSD